MLGTLAKAYDVVPYDGFGRTLVGLDSRAY